MKKFFIHWLNGKKEELIGSTVGDALHKAGYNQGSLSSMDFWSTLDIYVWREGIGWIPTHIKKSI